MRVSNQVEYGGGHPPTISDQQGEVAAIATIDRPLRGKCGRCESASGNIEGMTAPVAHPIEHDAPVTRTHGRACPTAIPVGRASGVRGGHC